MRIIVRHPDGREYAVTPEAVKRYEAEGFAVVGPEVGPLVLPARRKRLRVVVKP